jgi:DNA-binding transcriptional ArsR family regulator
VQDIRRSLGIAWGTAVYHLGRLERAGQVAVRHVGGHRGHWPLGQAPSRDALAPTGQALASLVRDRPGLTQLELARLAGIGAPAACKQLKRLEAAGAVLGERAGRVRLYRPTARLESMLAA